MPSTMTIILGAPASGKSSLSQTVIGDIDYSLSAIYLNRDSAGGTIAQLVPLARSALKQGKEVVLDNLFPTAESRKPFIDVARQLGARVDCIHVTTSIEDSIINALHRMWKRYGKLFLTTESLKEVKKDPNMFPICVFFKYKKEFEKPTLEEGFESITEIDFVREFPSKYDGKALILDYDQTIRDIDPFNRGEYDYPVKPEQVKVIPGRSEIIKKYKRDGYVILGASNQSGVAKGVLTHTDAVNCFEETNRQLGVPIDYMFCPHSVPPSCYCRKPQSGIGVHFIEKYKLDPRKCIFVGDQTTDKTFAERLSFQYVDQGEFFK